jgi:predicted permease
VIGHDVWRTRFGSDSAIVGREVRLGGTIHTIVGVMPPGFGFPMAHQYWTALRLDASEYERRQGPALQVFGRLASQATLASAQAELAAYSQRMASEHPRTHKDLRARVMPYQDAFNEREHSLQFALIQLLIVMLLGVVCTNVATLVYARTAARYSEIAVRSALGASRPRIVGHLFAEGLVLSMAATVVGLLISKVTIDQINTLLVGFEVAVPFWMRFHLSFGTMVYAVLLAAFASVVVGVTPALKATGRHVNASLQRISSGALGLQLGRTWTALIVAQAAFSVAAIPLPIYYARVFMEYGTANPGYRSNDFLLFRLRMDRDAPTVATAATYDREYTARFRARAADLVRRLEAEPGVTHVIHLSGVPGTASQVNIEVEGATTSMTGTTRVDIGFFEALGVPVVSGRVFSAADAGIAAGGEWRDGDGDGLAEYSPGPPVSSDAVMVNRSFVNEVLHGTNPLGRRLRYSGQVDDGQSTAPEVWYQIVGVVNDYPAVPMELDSPRAMVYHPIADGESVELMAIRLAGVPPSSFGERLRQITATVDPSLRLTDIRPLDVALREGHFALRMGAFGIVIVTMSVLLLAAAGIYALMSFTVERRRREIGIRVALGADRTRVVRGVFGRALRQLAIGVGVGAAIAPLILRLDGPITSQKIATLVAVSGGLLLVGVLALVGPTRRTLRIQPTEALREG